MLNHVTVIQVFNNLLNFQDAWNFVHISAYHKHCKTEVFTGITILGDLVFGDRGHCTIEKPCKCLLM